MTLLSRTIASALVMLQANHAVCGENGSRGKGSQFGQATHFWTSELIPCSISIVFRASRSLSFTTRKSSTHKGYGYRDVAEEMRTTRNTTYRREPMMRLAEIEGSSELDAGRWPPKLGREWLPSARHDQPDSLAAAWLER